MAKRKPKTETTLDELIETTVPEPTMVGDQSILDGIRQRKQALGNPAAQAQLIKERRRLIGAAP